MTPDDQSARTDPAQMRADQEAAYDEIFGPEDRLGDDVDQAVGVLRRARKILADPAMMASIRDRLEENKAAVEQAAGKRD
jgi:hypothetical protein